MVDFLTLKDYCYTWEGNLFNGSIQQQTKLTFQKSPNVEDKCSQVQG